MDGQNAQQADKDADASLIGIAEVLAVAGRMREVLWGKDLPTSIPGIPAR